MQNAMAGSFELVVLDLNNETRPTVIVLSVQFFIDAATWGPKTVQLRKFITDFDFVSYLEVHKSLKIKDIRLLPSSQQNQIGKFAY